MKIYYCILILFSPIFLTAQNKWFPIGAEWYYNLPYSESVNYVRFESIKDTLIIGKNCRQIKVTGNAFSGVFYEYIYQNSDSVFYYNNNEFSLLYNMSAQKGDTIKVHKQTFKPSNSFFYHDSIKNFEYVIIKTDSVNISNKWLRRQQIRKTKDSQWGFENGSSSSFIIDRIGNLQYLFGSDMLIYPEQTESLCRWYNDSEINFKSEFWSNECDFILNKELLYSENTNIYPTVISTYLNVYSKEYSYVIIYNSIGEQVFSAINNNDFLKINMVNFRNGIYFIKLQESNGKCFNQTIIKL